MDLPPMRPPTAPMPMPMYTQQQQPLSGIEKPHNNDVLCGRGVTTNRHVGNENFRSLVNCNKELYVTSTKKQKMRISRSIVEAVRSLEPAGRFLEKDQATGKWFDIGDKKAIEKTSQALRDGAAGLRKQLSEDLSDPDFLSAVFDMDVIPEKKTISKKEPKKTVPKKGHRRTKSNPSVGTVVRSKATIKKHQRLGEIAIPASPRTRHSIHLPMIPKPPQSPMSPRSGPASPRIVHSAGPAHRRAHSQGSVPFPPLLSSPGSYSSYYHGPPPRSGSFEYHDHPDSRRPYPPPPPPHQSYGAHPPSPSSHHYHGMPPRGYGGPPSPRFSPRQFTHHPTPPGHPPTGPPPTLSPYVHGDYRRSPDYHPPTNYSSPRGPYPRGGPGYSTNLAVPALGGERGVSSRHPLPMSPVRYPPPSPRNHIHRSNSSSPSGNLPVDFTPPPSARRTPSPLHFAKMETEGRRQSPRRDDGGSRGTPSTVSPRTTHMKENPDKISSVSPAAVVDVAPKEEVVKEELMLSPKDQDKSKDDEEFPFDEDPNPAGDDAPLSPLPFDHREDPTTLMELPENILSLPISPCGPHDIGEI